MNHGQLAFNGGELSPYGRHRVDFEKHPTGAEEMTNFLPHPFGSMVKRPGLAHIATFTHDTDEGKAFPFKSSDGTKYIICIDEDNGITIVRAADGTVADTLTYLSNSDIADNYSLGTDDMRELQFEPVNDVAFLTHQKIEPCRLTRNSDSDWTIEPIPYSYVPLANENSNPLENITLEVDTSGATAWSGSSVSYALGDVVTYSSDTYVCLYAHTSASNLYPVGYGGFYYQASQPDGYYKYSELGTKDMWYPIWARIDNDAMYHPNTPFTLASTEGIFTSDMVGSQIRLRRLIDEKSEYAVELDPNSGTTVTSASLWCPKSWSLKSFGTWTAEVTLQYSTDNATWSDIRYYEGFQNRNFDVAGELAEPGFVRVKAKDTGGASGTPFIELQVTDEYMEFFIEITSYTDANTASGTALTFAKAEEGITLYAEAAFNAKQGFPKAICLHEGRLCFASTDLQPNSIWLSQSDDYLNFETGVDDNDAIAKTLQAPFSDPIRWLASQRRLFIGTSKAEYVSGSETSDQPLTPANFVARKYTNAGSNTLTPLVYDDGVIFAGRGGGRLHEIGFEIERSSYAAEDLSRLSEHLTAPGVQSMDFQQTREPVVWMVRTDGVLLALSYNRKERLSAWSKHNTQDGTFEDVVVFPGDDGDDDVFFLVKRGSSTCLERFPSGWQTEIEDNSGWLAVDGVQGTGTSITVPTHLLNEDIKLLLNGDSSPVESDENYSSSPQAITSADYQIGFPIVAQYQSLPLDTQAEDGSTLSRKKRIHKVSLSLYQARGGTTWNKTSTDKQTIPNTDTSVVLRTQWEDTVVDPGHLDDAQLRIYHADPFPFTVRAAAIRWNLQERN
jgi:hypothetical protein